MTRSGPSGRNTTRVALAQEKVVGQGNVAQAVRYGEVISLRKVKYTDPSTGTCDQSHLVIKSHEILL